MCSIGAGSHRKPAHGRVRGHVRGHVRLPFRRGSLMAPSEVNILTGYWNDTEDPDLPPLKNWKHLVSRHPSIADQNPLDYCWHLDVHRRNVPPEAERKRGCEVPTIRFLSIETSPANAKSAYAAKIIPIRWDIRWFTQVASAGRGRTLNAAYHSNMRRACMS